MRLNKAGKFTRYVCADCHARGGGMTKRTNPADSNLDLEILRAAICQTLDVNGHLADGECCTAPAAEAGAAKFSHECDSEIVEANLLAVEMLEWAYDLSDLVPAMGLMILCDSAEIGGPDMILPVPGDGYTGLMIWFVEQEGEELNEDQRRWYETHRKASSPMHYEVIRAWGSIEGVSEIVMGHLDKAFSAVTVH